MASSAAVRRTNWRLDAMKSLLDAANCLLNEPSEAQLAELAGVALPVLGDLDAGVEVDGGAEDGFDLLAGHGADLAEPGALVADHDALLGVALDVQAGVDDEHRLVGGPVGVEGHLLDDDRDRVRQLVAHALERGLP